MLAKFKSEKMKSFIFMATLMVLLITAGMISSALVSDVATQEAPPNKTVSDVVIQYDNAMPSTINCPSYLRPDFEEHFWQLHDSINELIRHRNCRELEEIKSFIKNQREEK